MNKLTLGFPIKVLLLSFLIILTACGGGGGGSNGGDEPSSTPKITGDSTGTDNGTGSIGGDLTVSGNDSFVPVTGEGSAYGSFSINTSGTWTYTVASSNSSVVELGAGETATQNITVSTTGGLTQVITITIVGVNDAPVIGTGDGVDSATLSASSTTPATGTLTITDPDRNESVFISQTNTTGTYGTFSITSTGAWTYTLNTTNSSVQVMSTVSISATTNNDSDVFTVESADGTEHDVTILVTDIAEQTPEDTIILPSATGIDLQDWYLSIPVDNGGKATSIDENDIASDYTNPDFFYGIEEADGDKGIVMICPPRGATTSSGTYYSRVELREMLSRGAESSTKDLDNNWVFSSAPTSAQNAAAGVDGELNVTLAINHVTTTYGEDLSQVKDADKSKSKSQFEFQVGRVVIGQIHASSDEPIRLYYRKLPSHSKGSIYYYHEPTVGDEVLVNIIGDKNLDDNDAEPSNGIALNEKFSYNITVNGNSLDVTITRGDGTTVQAPTFDMTNSGFDTEDEWHYFKVGLYHLNNTAADEDYVQATFYEIRNSHTGYAESE